MIDGSISVQAFRPLLIFSAAQRRFALPLQEAAEILPLAALSHPPGLPEIVEGFLNLRGERIAVVRLERLLSGPCPPPERHDAVVVVKTEPAKLALWVDAGVEIRDLDPAQISPLNPQHALNGCAVSEICLEGRPVILLAADRLLLAEEKRRIEELRAKEQIRLEALNEQAA